MSASTVKPIRLEYYHPDCIVAADIHSNVFDFYFLIWSMYRLLCFVASGYSVAKPYYDAQRHGFHNYFFTSQYYSSVGTKI